MGETITVLVTVKAYPQLSQKYGEVVCVAGVRTDAPQPEWIRIFPINFRDLDFAERFKKYQMVTLRTTSGGSDTRPESRTPDQGTLTVGEQFTTDTDRQWRRGWAVLAPLAGAVTMCQLNRAQDAGQTAPSLGLIKPASVDGCTIEPNDDFTAEKARIAAAAAAETLFTAAKTVLEPAPYRVKYDYHCTDDGCRGHTQTLIDWEVGGAARRWRQEYGDDDSRLRSLLREKFLDQMCAPTRDVYFYVGNQHQHPRSFLVLGVFWPPAGSDPRTSDANRLF
jgi:hypothetical protein